MRQKLEQGEKVRGRKTGQGADERRQLRRRLLEAETRVGELEGELEDKGGNGEGALIIASLNGAK